MILRLVSIVALITFAAGGAAQSFDCAKAQTRIEKMVCANRSLTERCIVLHRMP